VQELVASAIVGMNPKYDCKVIETPSYLSLVCPSACAQGFDTLTDNPIQRYLVTTDPKRDPLGGFAELVNTLVHEEYGHCLHFSNSATAFAATPSIVELLPSLHGGATSEGLSFQRELELIDYLERVRKKKPKDYTDAEKRYVEATKEFGGFERTFVELLFATYRFRVIRFLRVIGDVRINSGKQDLLAFLEWTEKKTGISARTMFYQIFPGHESIFAGYATCYAVVGQDIKAIQRPFKNDSEKMVKFNAYACSMGYPARSIYIKRLRAFAKEMMMRSGKKRARPKRRR
jgi:hypothetical protein